MYEYDRIKALQVCNLPISDHSGSQVFMVVFFFW
jgi:hypothetical protein